MKRYFKVISGGNSAGPGQAKSNDWKKSKPSGDDDKNNPSPAPSIPVHPSPDEPQATQEDSNPALLPCDTPSLPLTEAPALQPPCDSLYSPCNEISPTEHKSQGPEEERTQSERGPDAKDREDPPKDILEATTDARRDEVAAHPLGATAAPLRLMTWNVNSLLVRLKSNREEVSAFIQKWDPDYIALQEVRVPGAGKKGCPVNQSEIKCDTKAAAEERQFLLGCLQKPPFSLYRVWWSLGETKYGGTAVLLKRHLKPLSVSFALEDLGTAKPPAKGPSLFRAQSPHEKDGRAILVGFPSVAILNTYVPNNGFCRGSPSFERRRQWDARMMRFLRTWRDDAAAVPLIWCGDLNVSPGDDDVSHPEFFRTATRPGEAPADDPGWRFLRRLQNAASFQGHRARLHLVGESRGKVSSKETSPQ